MRAESSPALWSNRQSRVLLPFLYDETLHVPALAVSKAFACSPHRDSTAKGVPETVLWYLPSDFSRPDRHMHMCMCMYVCGRAVHLSYHNRHGSYNSLIVRHLRHQPDPT